MHKTQILPVESSITSDFYRLDPAEYSKKSFSMFGGREELVTLEAKENLAGAVLDRFGMQTSFFKTEFGFRFSVHVIVSPTFFAWVMAFGENMRIIEPLLVREEMKDMIRRITSNYE